MYNSDYIYWYVKVLTPSRLETQWRSVGRQRRSASIASGCETLQLRSRSVCPPTLAVRRAARRPPRPPAATRPEERGQAGDPSFATRSPFQTATCRTRLRGRRAACRASADAEPLRVPGPAREQTGGTRAW